MFPVLFQFHLFGRLIQIPGYGFMVATGFVGAVVVAFRQGKKQGIESDQMLDLWFWIVMGALVGSRFLYVVLNWEQFTGRLLRVFDFWEGGLVFYGGLIAASAVAVLVIRLESMPGLRTADVVAPAVALGHAFGRMGCFAAGCCFGQPTGSSWGARFSGWSIAYQEMAHSGRIDPLVQETTAALHPTQLYEAIGEAFIFFALMHLSKKKRFDGAIIAAYLVAYSVLRFCTELFRGDQTRGYLVQPHWPWLNRFLGVGVQAHPLLSTSQAISLVAAVLGTGLFVFLARRSRTTGCGPVDADRSPGRIGRVGQPS